MQTNCSSCKLSIDVCAPVETPFVFLDYCCLENKFYMNEFNIVELLVDVALIWIISYTKFTAEVISFRSLLQSEHCLL